jgi:hypothetical protein
MYRYRSNRREIITVIISLRGQTLSVVKVNKSVLCVCVLNWFCSHAAMYGSGLERGVGRGLPLQILLLTLMRIRIQLLKMMQFRNTACHYILGTSDFDKIS